jgi:hypothetical protein
MPISDEQMNTLMQNIQANIPTDCGAYEDIRDRSQHQTILLGKDEFAISDYEAYRNDIEFVNSFNEQVLIDEAQYFKNKYSETVYEYLKEQRAEFSAQQRLDTNARICGSNAQNNSGGSSTQCPDKCNSEEQLEKNKKCEESQNFLSYLTNQAKSAMTRPETTYKKIEYRNEAHELLDSLNYWMTVSYFVLLIVMLILLATSNRLNLMERFPLYLFLFLLPIIFPYLFEGFKYLYEYLFPDTPSRGPSDAFIESL